MTRRTDESIARRKYETAVRAVLAESVIIDDPMAALGFLCGYMDCDADLTLQLLRKCGSQA